MFYSQQISISYIHMVINDVINICFYFYVTCFVNRCFFFLLFHSLQRHVKISALNTDKPRKMNKEICLLKLTRTWLYFKKTEKIEISKWKILKIEGLCYEMTSVKTSVKMYSTNEMNK